METVDDIIDFAQWYSGMDRAKVKRAYFRYLKEVKKEDVLVKKIKK
jgi:hypothetical protein